MTQAHSDKYTANNADDFVDKIASIAVAAGWTLHDDLRSGSPYAVVLKSVGESGNEIPCYFYINTSTTADRLDFKLYKYWDNATHAGTYATYSSYSVLAADLDGSFDSYVTANKDSLFFASLMAAKWNCVGLGLMVPVVEDAIGELQSGVSSGSSVVVQLGSGEAEGFLVNGTYQIVDDNTRQDVTVSAVDTDNDQITISSLSYSFSAGAFVGNRPYKWLLFIGLYNHNYTPTRAGANGSGDITSNNTMNCAITNLSYCDPCSRSHGKYVLCPPFFYDNDALGGLPNDNYLYAYVDINSTLNEHTLSLGDIDSGTSSGSNTSTTLNDTSKSWTTDEHQNKVLIITAGTGAGQMRKITSNTGTALTVPAWTVTPDATSQYTICEEGWMYFYFNSTAAAAAALRLE